MRFLFSLFGILFTITSCNTAHKQTESNTEESKITTFYFIRHAEKMKDQGPDPELTAKGISRAQAWVNFFMLKDVDYVLSSDFKRTRQTAAPLAKSKGLETVIYDVKQAKAIDFLNEYRGKTVAVFGHSNTINAYTNELQKDSVYNSLNENDYDHYFYVRVSDTGKSSGVKELMDFMVKE